MRHKDSRVLLGNFGSAIAVVDAIDNPMVFAFPILHKEFVDGRKVPILMGMTHFARQGRVLLGGARLNIAAALGNLCGSYDRRLSEIIMISAGYECCSLPERPWGVCDLEQSI